jgi:EAL domain-containing protein (putative c-di-GMP-specific phosphodiesterase class I)
MAHDLHLHVIAEGVESAEQLSDRTRLACDDVQGDSLSEPLPAEQCEAMRRSPGSAAPERESARAGPAPPSKGIS